jgi:hypothetical protein
MSAVELQPGVAVVAGSFTALVKAVLQHQVLKSNL